MIEITNTAATTSTDALTGEIIEVPAVKQWAFAFARTDMFNNISLRTNYINDRKPAEKRDDNRILLEDDLVMFNKYLSSAVADLNIILARYYESEFSNYDIDEGSIYLTLSLGNNFKDSVAYSMDEYIKQFIEAKILLKWFGPEVYELGIDVELKEAEDKLRSAINYRKSPVHRPINSFL